MKKIIMDYIERSIWYRFFLGVYPGFFLVFMLGLLFFMSKVNFNLIYLAVFFFASIIASLTYLEEYKYYTYRIELDGNFLKLKTYLWRKKKVIELDLSNVTIYYSGYGIVMSVKYMILFYDGVNTPLYKTKKILHRINPESSIFYRDWTQEKVKALYEKLIEIQKEVIEKNSKDKDYNE